MIIRLITIIFNNNQRVSIKYIHCYYYKFTFTVTYLLAYHLFLLLLQHKMIIRLITIIFNNNQIVSIKYIHYYYYYKFTFTLTRLTFIFITFTTQNDHSFNHHYF